MMITAILVTYNSEAVIESALRCVYHHPKAVQCIIVDNASTDSTQSIIQRNFPEARIIANPDNVGFGRACNQALEMVSTELALLLNPDAFIDSDGIDRLAAAFSLYTDAAIIAPFMEHQGSRKQIALLLDDAISEKATDSAAGNNAIPIRFFSGALALWRMEYMKKVGFFDPAFFLFYEDDDISIRTHRAGYRILALPGINVRHTPGKSCALTPQVESLKLRSSTWSYLYILHKYRGKVAAGWASLSLLARNIGVFWRWNPKPDLRIHQLQEALIIFDEVWLEMRNQLDNQLALATAEHEQCLKEAEKSRDEEWKRTEEITSKQWEELVKQHKEKEIRLIDKFHAENEKNTSMRSEGDELRRFKALVSGLEEEWTALNHQHEKDHQKAAKMMEMQWQVTACYFQKQWESIFKAHEKRLQQLARAYEKKRMATQKELASLHAYREKYDKIWAVLYFFRNPERFDKNAS